MPDKKYKILLDTDIGDDIDDAYALVYGLRNQVYFVGITTVFKNTFKRASVAKKILELSKVQVPVYAGYGHGLRVDYDIKSQPVYYTNDLNHERYQADNSDSEEAIDFMIDCALKYKKELIIVCIGPLTNIAKAIIKNKEAISNVDKIVIMGGAYFEHFREWNIFVDPEAAKILFDSGIKLECAGVDVTYDCRVDHKQLNTILDSKDNELNEYLVGITKLWRTFPHFDLPCLHDSLALSIALDQEYVEMEEIEATVETEGKYTRGFTINLSNYYRNRPNREKGKFIKVAKTVNAKSFLDDHLKDTFKYE